MKFALDIENKVRSIFADDEPIKRTHGGPIVAIDDAALTVADPDSRAEYDTASGQIAIGQPLPEGLLQPYAINRALNYPAATELNDALVKQSSTDPVVAAAGEAQEAQYYADCLAVKAAWPKPE